MSKYEKPLLMAEKDMELIKVINPSITDEELQEKFKERFNYYLKIL